MDNQQKQELHFNRTVYRDIVYGWFYIQIGKPEKIASWLKSDFEESDLNSMIHGLEIIVKAKYLFAEKRYPAVIAELENHSEKSKAWSFVMGKLEAKVLEAVCRYRHNDAASSFRSLEEAWDLAKDNGFYLPFMELGKNMRALADAALKQPSIKIPKTILEKIRRNAA
jgi:LuxR family maltose regulon positive regulatory protein